VTGTELKNSQVLDVVQVSRHCATGIITHAEAEASETRSADAEARMKRLG
jgi:hypothetical protein